MLTRNNKPPQSPSRELTPWELSQEQKRRQQSQEASNEYQGDNQEDTLPATSTQKKTQENQEDCLASGTMERNRRANVHELMEARARQERKIELLDTMVKALENRVRELSEDLSSARMACKTVEAERNALHEVIRLSYQVAMGKPEQAEMVSL